MKKFFAIPLKRSNSEPYITPPASLTNPATSVLLSGPSNWFRRKQSSPPAETEEIDSSLLTAAEFAKLVGLKVHTSDFDEEDHLIYTSSNESTWVSETISSFPRYLRKTNAPPKLDLSMFVPPPQDEKKIVVHVDALSETDTLSQSGSPRPQTPNCESTQLTPKPQAIPKHLIIPDVNIIPATPETFILPDTVAEIDVNSSENLEVINPATNFEERPIHYRRGRFYVTEQPVYKPKIITEVP